MNDCPPFLYPLTRDVPASDDAFAACVLAYRGRDLPTHLCRQCYSEPLERSLLTAAKLVADGGEPAPEDYAQICFEHPGCSGGEETVKLFTPYAVRDLLTGCPPEGFSEHSYPEIVETLVQSGFWFWPEMLKQPMRQFSIGMFWDWFERGHYPWRHMTYPNDPYLGPGDDILRLCSLCQIDPYDLVEQMSLLHTPWADAAMCGPLNFSVGECTYVAADTGKDTHPYQIATKAIADELGRREATAYMQFITKDWADAAFFRHTQTIPDLAQELSEFANYYEIRTVETVKACKTPALQSWPVLPVI